MSRLFTGIATALLLLTHAAYAQTVTVSLTSPKDGRQVQPGTLINWTITFHVSTGDNLGLALLATDLVHGPGNPQLFDIPAADSVPIAMSNFSRPDGISQPGDGNEPSGYVGVWRGQAGARTLFQIGGAQNVFGQAMTIGTGMGENAVVIGGIGQSGDVVLAQGSFTAPATPGAYTFSLKNVIANVFTAVNAPPTASPTLIPAIDLSNGSISFTVGGPQPCPGDIDANGAVDLADIATFLAAFGEESASPDFVSGADLDGDSVIALGDLAGMLGAYGVPCP
ncbi:MAG: hypothetical protein KDA32_12455 [Phycisphaerales bacterium]|nr:hypothetical protein [Phycisphaerales bacterium]